MGGLRGALGILRLICLLGRNSRYIKPRKPSQDVLLFIFKHVKLHPPIISITASIHVQCSSETQLILLQSFMSMLSEVMQVSSNQAIDLLL